MKFFHLSDLHLGKRVNGFPMIEDQKYILDRVIELIDREHPDAVIVAGDVYDKSIPPVEAVNLFDDFLVSLAARSVQVFIVSGNHDSAERVSYGGRVMEHSGIHISRRITGARRDEEPEEADDLYADSVEGEPLGSADPYTDDAEGEASEAADLHEDLEAPAVSDLHAEGGDRKSVESAVSGTGGVIVPVRLEDAYGPVYVYLFPYIHPSVVRDAWPDDRIVTWTDAMETLIRHAGVDPDARNIAVAHQYVTANGVRPQESDSEQKHIGGLDNVEYSGEKGQVEISKIPLQASRVLKTVKGAFAEVMSPEFTAALSSEDYYRVILTDEHDIDQALYRLRSRFYKNLMEIKYDNTRTGQADDGIAAEEEALDKEPIEVLGELYEKQNGTGMSEFQKELAARLIAEIWGNL